MNEPVLIGELRPDRLACGPAHLPTCFNPHLDATWCICGTVQWPGNVGTWHSVPRYDSHSRGARLLGWDTYFLPAPAEGREEDAR